MEVSYPVTEVQVFHHSGVSNLQVKALIPGTSPKKWHIFKIRLMPDGSMHEALHPFPYYVWAEPKFTAEVF